MRVTFQVRLVSALLLALCIAGLLACAVAWFILLSTICSSPRIPVPQARQVIAYNCHGMKVFISPGQQDMLDWLGPAGLLLGFLAVVAAARAIRRTDAAPRVRIIAVPPGDAPQWVREKWVGLELPLAQWSAAPARHNAKSVLGGADRKRSGFKVHVTEALAVLETKSPEAAQWWRTNTPYLVKPWRCFLFSEEACQVVSNPPETSAASP